MKVHVALLDDRGNASQASDFFRSEQFLVAEGVTHTLVARTASSRLSVPLIVRPVSGEQGWDATSPYGYPGGSARGTILQLRRADLSGLGLVSIFIRDRIDRPTIRDGQRRSQVFIYNPSRPRRIRRSVAQVIRKNSIHGYYSEVVPGPCVDAATVSEFGRCYRQTMQRNSAPSRYFFSDAYLRTCLSSYATWLVLTRGADESLAAAALVVRSDGYLHHYLGCTADEHIAVSPSKNACAAVLDLADRLSIPVNLGGGVSPNDGIEYFKRGFANSTADFVTHELICDISLYSTLAANVASAGPKLNKESFFPLYRA
jgi:hypothetical protein